MTANSVRTAVSQSNWLLRAGAPDIACPGAIGTLADCLGHLEDG